MTETQGAGEARSGDEDVEAVVAGVGEDGFGSAQEREKWLAPKEDGGDEEAAQEGEEKAGAGNLAGLFGLAFAEAEGDEAAAAHAEGEADGLDEGHEGKGDAYGAGGFYAELGDEEGVGQIVDGGDEHAAHGGER